MKVASNNQGHRSSFNLPTTSCLSPDDAIVSDVSDRAAFDLRDDGFVNAASRAMVGLIVVAKVTMTLEKISGYELSLCPADRILLFASFCPSASTGRASS